MSDRPSCGWERLALGFRVYRLWELRVRVGGTGSTWHYVGVYGGDGLVGSNSFMLHW